MWAAASTECVNAMKSGKEDYKMLTRVLPFNLKSKSTTNVCLDCNHYKEKRYHHLMVLDGRVWENDEIKWFTNLIDSNDVYECMKS